MHLHWPGDATLSIEEIGRLPMHLVWTLHDQWAFCVAEHYTCPPGPCETASSDDRFALRYSPASRPAHEPGCDLNLNHRTWLRKRRAWRRPMQIVCPSTWLADCARRSTLLERYRHDTHIWRISGNNFQNGQWRGDGSYYFSRYNHCWGWSSSRRCWQHDAAALIHWAALRESGMLDRIFEDPLERQFWSAIWQRLLDEVKPDIWAYRWSPTCLANGALIALPNRNLVSNVGLRRMSRTPQVLLIPRLLIKVWGR